MSKEFIRLMAESLSNVTTPERIVLIINRSIQVKGLLGVIKQDFSFRRFLIRKNKKVRIELLLLIAFGYSVNKLHNKMINNKNVELLKKNIISKLLKGFFNFSFSIHSSKVNTGAYIKTT